MFKPNLYFIPLNYDELYDLLEKYPDNSRIIGGGTTIYELAHKGLLSDINVLIDLKNLNLINIIEVNNSLKIETSVTFSQMENNSIINSSHSYSSISDSLKQIHPIQVKNVATIGGTICASIPFYDLPVSLVSSDSKIIISSRNGERSVPIDEFFIDYFFTSLQPGEFVRELLIPNLSNSAGAFEKFALTGNDWALVNASVQIQLDENKCIKYIRIALGGGIGNKIMRAINVENSLIKQIPNLNLINKSSKLIFDDVNPIDDVRASSNYRKKLYPVIIKKVILKSLNRLGVNLN